MDFFIRTLRGRTLVEYTSSLLLTLSMILYEENERQNGHVSALSTIKRKKKRWFYRKVGPQHEVREDEKSMSWRRGREITQENSRCLQLSIFSVSSYVWLTSSKRNQAGRGPHAPLRFLARADRGSSSKPRASKSITPAGDPRDTSWEVDLQLFKRDMDSLYRYHVQNLGATERSSRKTSLIGDIAKALIWVELRGIPEKMIQGP